jgi:hypothetical protein
MKNNLTETTINAQTFDNVYEKAATEYLATQQLPKDEHIITETIIPKKVLDKRYDEASNKQKVNEQIQANNTTIPGIPDTILKQALSITKNIGSSIKIEGQTNSTPSKPKSNNGQGL